jgi:DNA-binding XRE family transcriptional regulator
MTDQGQMTCAEMRQIRKDAGLTQAELAEAIGMARETVGAMERGSVPVERRTALAIRHVTMRAEVQAEDRPDDDAVRLATALIAVLDGRYRRI